MVPPSDAAQWTRCQPIYLEMPGWKRSIEKVKKFANLPNEAKSYVRRIAELTGPRLTMVSVGPARGQTLFL